MNSNETLILEIKVCQNAIKRIYVHKPFILLHKFLDKNIVLGLLLVQKNLDNFVDYLGYYIGSIAVSHQ